MGKNPETLDYWNVGLSKNYGVKDLGIQNVLIQKCFLEATEKTVYAVTLETVSELVSSFRGENVVYNTLVKNAVYDVGELEIVAIFETYEEARNFAKNSYPGVDMKKLISEYCQQ